MYSSRKVLTIILIALFGGLILFAQSKPEKFKDKLKKIKDGDKIVVSTSEGDVVFEGKDAEKLLARFGAKGMSWSVETDDDGQHEIMIISDDGDTSISKAMTRVFVVNDDDEEDGFNITVNGGNRDLTIKKDDGETYVKDVYEENGEKKTVELRGKEADEYLEKLEDEGEISMFEGDTDFEFITVGESSDSESTKIEIEMNGESKKVTVTTKDEDGNETTKVYEGDEADEYLKKHGDHNAIFFKNGFGKNRFKFKFDGDFDDLENNIKVNVKKIMDGKKKVIIIDEDDD